jgi:phenylacetic acid degradation operon negative regulatory protein
MQSPGSARPHPPLCSSRRLPGLFYDPLRDDPGLPVELLPPDWPGAELAEAYVAVTHVLGPALDEYLRSIGPPTTGSSVSLVIEP